VQKAKRKVKVLFLCTGNSCRSQMAEAWARQEKGDLLEPHSAGVRPRPLDPRAVRVMAEAEVDISGQRPKHVSKVMDLGFDCVVTLCDAARESCPRFPGTGRVIHRSFDDPPRLARAAADEQDALDHYRRVRDEIRAFVQGLPEALETEEAR